MDSSTDVDKRVRFNLNNNDVIYIKNNHKLNEHENPNSNNGNHIHIHNHIKTSPHPEYEENRSLLAKDNPNNISVWNKLNHKDHERIINPLLPPERSYVNTYGIPINVPSRGYSRGYQQVGLLYKKDGVEGERQVGNDTSSNILPLFGQAVYPGSNKFNYYVTSDKFNNVKMPFTMNNGKKSDDTYGIEELQDKQEIFLEEYNSNFVGSFGDFGAISFHETKNLHCGLGGCLIINNKKYLRKTKYIWNRGTNRSDFDDKLIKSYSWQELGGNYYPSELQSVILYNQLNTDKEIFKLRKQIYKQYLQELNKIKSKLFKINIFKNTNYHSIYLICKNHNIRNLLKNWFKKLSNAH